MLDYEVRNGQRVVPTCPECGCRLGQFEDMWYHYVSHLENRDAKGHRCSLLNNFWESPQENKNLTD